MLEKFLSFILEHHLFSKNNKILLAISGGVDSIAMCKLFQLLKANEKFKTVEWAIAHCNFQLRGKDAEQDEKFVMQLAENYKVKFYSKKFETDEFSEDKKISIQMAARELRYEWLEKIRKNNNYDFIASAHHRNDTIETVLLNIIRGTGIKGLHGILPQQDKIIRPLLFTNRNEIIDFVHYNQLIYREDNSNLTNKYQRNKIRNQIIPLLKEINPELENTMIENTVRWKDAEQIYMNAIKIYEKEFLQKKNNEIFISILKLKKYQPLKTLLFEIISGFNFNIQQVEQIIKTFDKDPGKIFLSSSHRLLKDRNFLILSPIGNKTLDYFFIEKDEKNIELEDFQLKIKIIENKNFTITKSSNFACLDYEKLKFPLKIRGWNKGDYFYPLGMKKKKKKLSDFFVDQKISITEKEKIRVLFSEERVAWIAGYRIDDRFKITPNTKKIFILEKIS